MIEQAHSTILVVDDDDLGRAVIAAYLERENYVVEEAEDGLAAKAMLEDRGHAYAAVLLDLNMPRMDGLALLKWMKGRVTLQDVPVIIQTGATTSAEIALGIRAGAYYYLPKPIDLGVLGSVVGAAVRSRDRYNRLENLVVRHSVGLNRMTSGTFHVRTQEEANDLAVTLSLACPDPQARVIGLFELLINAIEHGNLGLSHEEKADLLARGELDEELERRSALAEYAVRYVTTSFRRYPDRIEIEIEDQGDGFDWHPYVDADPNRATALNGRGIAIARRLSFDHLEYRGKGNIVAVQIKLPPGDLQPWADAALTGTGKDDQRVARAMQADLLPDTGVIARLNAAYALDLSAHYEMSAGLGGDIWGLRPIDRSRFALYLVDFSGHGVAAAFNVFRLDTIMRKIAAPMDDPAACLAEISDRLADLLPTGQYATMMLGVVDVANDRFSYAAAASPSPIVRRDDGKAAIAIGDGSGLPLGIVVGARYETRTMAFPPGASLVLYSDALFEAGREAGLDVGRRGVVDYCAAHAATAQTPLNADAIVGGLLGAHPRPLSDDLTVVVCRR